MSSEYFSISTPDPAFDPNGPILVNGYMFLPAKSSRVVQRPRKPVLVEGRRKRVIERA